MIGIRGTRGALALAVLVWLTLVTAPSVQAQTFAVLHSFTGSPDGAGPYGGLVRDAAKIVYGTTYLGGTSDSGTVFKVDRNNTETTLHSFTGGSRDGANPYAGVIMDAKGSLYGVTYAGGGTGCGGGGCGAVFKLNKTGNETLLYSFRGGTRDGCHPYGDLILDRVGNLYGTTYQCGSGGYGTVFKFSATGKETVLHSFTGYPDGAYPFLTSLLMDKTGHLYGVTSDGGRSFLGVLYKLSKDGTLTVLHNFTGGETDGCYPLGTPAMDRQGSLYGTAAACGSSGGGILWKVGGNGTETVLHNFGGGSSDGLYPYAGVLRGADGNFYGDTEDGGSSNLGTIYQMTGSGTLIVLHSFSGTDGESPYGGLIRNNAGDLYGTTYSGGSGSSGTVWKLSP